MSQIDRDRALANWAHHVGKSRPITRAEMEARVARFRDIPSSPRAFADTAIPGHRRTLMSVIGRGVTENPDFLPAIPHAENFHIDYIEAERGNGAALHSHDTEEVFVVITGRWAVRWGDEGEEEVVLEEGDVISVPPGVMRSFENLAEGRHRLLSVLGGHDPGRVKWAETVAAAGRAAGVGFDDRGNAVHLGPG
jgi:mannose-6-phosphate isomerase-like protein (cupin superfamily)